jgi:class 3 adenylate cyclase
LIRATDRDYSALTSYSLAVSANPPRRERKVVTVLFCDLVGFTSQAESLDPEDVEAILRPYHTRVRGELERHGGTVEKFIGDAVMALFGAPVAHEDDPERAVRAGSRSATSRSRKGSSSGSGSPPERRSSPSTRAMPRGRAWRPATS